jgi:hypothetical protein
MDPRFRAILSTLLLTLALGKVSSLPGQQPTVSPKPATQTPAIPLQSPVPPEIADLRKQSRSHLRLERPTHAVDVYLLASDEKVEVLDASFCGGDKGAKQYSGHYQLGSVMDNALVSRLDLDPDANFVERKPHNGTRLYRDPQTAQDLVMLLQYGSCNSESAQFFSADPGGQLFAIPFRDKDGRTWSHALTGPDGAIPHLADGSLVFCAYANNLGYDFCAAYAFDGANFQETAKWMTQELGDPLKGLNPTGQATRALFDFLSNLSSKNYSAAAYYFGGKVESGGTAPAAANSAEKAKILKAYCTTQGGQCLVPAKIESKAGASAESAMTFRVSFETPDFKPFTIGDRASFAFRVVKTADGMKVLDLPPTFPEPSTYMPRL